MKIAVIIPTRNKPDMLLAVITAYSHLASGNHNVEYFVRIDTDEYDWYVPVVTSIIDRGGHVQLADAPLVPAMKVLDLVEWDAFKKFDPDAYVLVADDVFPLAQHWDDIIASVIESSKIDAFCWQESGDPHNTSYLIMSKKYVKALPAYLPTWFPFWFVDTWHAEVHLMAFNKPLPIITNLPIGGKRGKTYGMRDLKFWFNFFSSTRPDRIKEAKTLAANFGLEFTYHPDMIEYFKRRDAAQLAKSAEYEEKFAGEANPRYDEAKTRAEEHIKSINDTPSEVKIDGNSLTVNLAHPGTGA